MDDTKSNPGSGRRKVESSGRRKVKSISNEIIPRWRSPNGVRCESRKAHEARSHWSLVKIVG
jgi:hypothetical protein